MSWIKRVMHGCWRSLVFWGGDIRRLHSFPWITWDVHQHRIEYEEVLAALPLIRAGDVGLHRDEGYLSNFAIPGFMKHAWIHVDSPKFGTGINQEPVPDVTDMKIVEAVSEGVLRRSALFPIRSDFAIILRPKDVTADEVTEAVNKATGIIGCEYDVKFEFDIEEELKRFNESEQSHQSLRMSLVDFKKGLTHWDGGFCCTEVAAYSWWHKREQLRLFRKERRGKMVIAADDFINGGFEIVWASDSCTPEAAVKMGLGEEGVEMLKAYRVEHPVQKSA